MQAQMARLTLILSSVLMLPLNTALAAIECKPVPQQGPNAAPIINYLNPSHAIQLERIVCLRRQHGHQYRVEGEADAVTTGKG